MSAALNGYVPVEQGQLYYETAGDPAHPALVMIHAGVANLRMWDDQVAQFADRYYCVRYDTRGYGRSQSENTQFSNRTDLLTLLDHLKIDRAILMGCSRGGQIAIDFTLEQPSRVRALILSGAGLGGWADGQNTPEEDALFGQMEEAYKIGDLDKVDALDLRVWYDGYKRPIEQVDPVYRAKGAAMIAENRPHTLKHGPDGLQAIPLNPPAAYRIDELHVPMLVIVGDLDESYTQQMAAYMAKTIKGATGVVIPGTAHLPNLEFPAIFNRHVEDFLAKL